MMATIIDSLTNAMNAFFSSVLHSSFQLNADIVLRILATLFFMVVFFILYSKINKVIRKLRIKVGLDIFVNKKSGWFYTLAKWNSKNINDFHFKPGFFDLFSSLGIFVFFLIFFNIFISFVYPNNLEWKNQTLLQNEKIFDDFYYANNKDAKDKPIIHIQEYGADWIATFGLDLNTLIEKRIIFKHNTKGLEYYHPIGYKTMFSDMDNYTSFYQSINATVKEKYPIIEEFKDKELLPFRVPIISQYLNAKDMVLSSLLTKYTLYNSPQTYTNKQLHLDVNFIKNVEEYEKYYQMYWNTFFYDLWKLQNALEKGEVSFINFLSSQVYTTWSSKAYPAWEELKNWLLKIIWTSSFSEFYRQVNNIQNIASFNWVSFINLIVSIVMIFIFASFFNKTFNIGKLSKIDIVSEKDIGDVVKMWWNEDLKTMLDEIIKLNSISNHWAKIKWILLYWPPGTWKTLFWKQLAKRLWLPFSYISAGSFADKFVGWTQSKVKNLFNDIRKNIKKKNIKQCILFLDELDSIGEKRERWTEQYSKDWLNQLLTEIDGIKADDWIILVGATNRLDSLDDALMSRFDYKVLVNLPNRKAREDIIKNHLIHLYEHSTDNWYVSLNWVYEWKVEEKNKKLVFDWNNPVISEKEKHNASSFQKDTLKKLHKEFITTFEPTRYKAYKTNLYTSRVQRMIYNIYESPKKFRIKRLSKKVQIVNPSIFNDVNLLYKHSLLTEHFSWRDLKKVIDIAYNKAIIKEKSIDDRLLWESIEEFIIWKDKENIFSEEQLKIIAYHELWHAIVSKRIGQLVTQISIAAKSMSLGQTFAIDAEDKILPSQQDLLNDVYKLLAGRAAELIYIWQITTWSSNDYERATELLKKFALLNFSYQPKNISFIEARLWIKDVKSHYSMGYVCKYQDLNQDEQAKVLEMVKIIIADCEAEVESILKEEVATFEYYLPIIIKDLVIFGADFELKSGFKTKKHFFKDEEIKIKY